MVTCWNRRAFKNELHVSLSEVVVFNHKLVCWIPYLATNSVLVFIINNI